MTSSLGRQPKMRKHVEVYTSMPIDTTTSMSWLIKMKLVGIGKCTEADKVAAILVDSASWFSMHEAHQLFDQCR